MDHTDIGIFGKMGELEEILRVKDPLLWRNLEDKNLQVHFYCFRWISLLYSQEFQLKNLIKIWDCLFSDPERFDFVYYIGCSMLIYVRYELFEGDFAENLKLLLDFPQVDSSVIIALAKKD